MIDLIRTTRRSVSPRNSLNGGTVRLKSRFRQSACSFELTMKRTTANTNYESNDFPLQPGDAFVAICDWNGIVKWLSNHSIKTQVGDYGWVNMVEEDAERFKNAFAKTATLHEKGLLEISSLNGLRYRIWLWSIGNPELAVCTFNLLIPTEIEKLTNRERELMENLASGATLKRIAETLEVSVNTLHTHMRNIKKKLKLSGSGEVAAFAAKFFHERADLSKTTNERSRK